MLFKTKKLKKLLNEAIAIKFKNGVEVSGILKEKEEEFFLEHPTYLYPVNLKNIVSLREIVKTPYLESGFKRR